MNGDPFRKVQPGEPLAIPAKAYNAFIDAAQAHRAGAQAITRPSRNSEPGPATIFIRNGSGVDVPRFGVLGIDGPIIAPTDNLDAFQNQPAFTGVAPAAGTHDGRFAVVQEPLASGAIGRALVDGLTVVQINVTDTAHGYADIADGDASQLVSSTTGSARILWAAATGGGTGTQWALVSLGHSAAGGGSSLTLVDIFPAQITRSDIVPGQVHRYRYAWIEITLGDGQGGDVDEIVWAPSQRYGTFEYDGTTYALNLDEIRNNVHDVIGDINTNGPDYPSGFTPRRIGGGIGNPPNTVVSPQNPVGVLMAEFVDKNGNHRYVFDKRIAHDGTCTP